MVGGLADWFAVTALFRHPLGLKIPHTNLIPENQSRIAEGVARYIDSEFLQRDTLISQLRRVDVADKIAALLNNEKNREKMADGLMKFIPRVLDGRRDGVIVAAVTAGLRRGVADLDLRPVFARLTSDVVRSDDLIQLINSLGNNAQAWLNTNRSMILQSVEEGSPWWVPDFVDRRLADGLINSGIKLLKSAQEADTKEGKALRQWLSNLPGQVERSDILGTKIVSILNKFLSGQEVESITRSIWTDIKKMINGDLTAEESNIRAALLTFLESISSDILDSVEIRRRINSTVEAFFVENIPKWRVEICSYIEQTLSKQDPNVFSRRLELQVGKDLQFIRINGTVFGAIIGIALHWVNSNIVH